MQRLPGEGQAAPALLRARRFVMAPGLPLRVALDEALLLEEMRLAEQGDAFWHAAALVPARWHQATIQVGTN